MRRSEALAILTAYRREFDNFGVKSLSIFGSVARDEAVDRSDIDVLVEFDGPATFDKYIELKDLLEDILGRPVDLVTRKSIKPRFARVIERDVLDVV
jgi:hypothetical protein